MQNELNVQAETQTATDAGREAKRDYARRWRKAHPENVRKNNRNYWENVARKMTAQASEEGVQNGV